jgi:hypothetical protein
MLTMVIVDQGLSKPAVGKAFCTSVMSFIYILRLEIIKNRSLD